MHFKTGQHYITYTVTMDAIDMEWSGWKQTNKKPLCSVDSEPFKCAISSYFPLLLVSLYCP